MTQCEKILRYLLKHNGMTMRDGYLMYINSPHKRIGELERAGVKIDHLTIKRNGKSIVLYRLADREQKEINDFLGGVKNGNGVSNV